MLKKIVKGNNPLLSDDVIAIPTRATVNLLFNSTFRCLARFNFLVLMSGTAVKKELNHFSPLFLVYSTAAAAASITLHVCGNMQ